MRQEKLVWTTSGGYIKNAFKLLFIFLYLCSTFQLSRSPPAFCRPCSVFLESLLRPRTAILVECWMCSSAEVAFNGKQNPCLGGDFCLGCGSSTPPPPTPFLVLPVWGSWRTMDLKAPCVELNSVYLSSVWSSVKKNRLNKLVSHSLLCLKCFQFCHLFIWTPSILQ